MPAMSALRLDGNLFNGTLSNSIGQFNLLMEFTLATNYVTGTIPSSIGNISTLQYFELSVNKFTGTFPSCLWNLTEIITLEVDHNLLSGTIHGPFEQWEIIQELNVAHNNFTGILSPAMCNCSTMEFFQLNNNQFSGPIPPCLGNLTALHHLELAYNNVTGSIPDAVYSSKNLTNLSLAYNKMTGTLSNLLGQLSTLQYIDIGFNYFTSSLPIEWSTLTSLQEIYLEGNHFTGHIEMQSPSAVDKLHKENITTHLTQLRVMQFANNHFSGSIPHELYNVTTLIELYLVDNQLTGTLPEAVSRLHDLVELTLSYNHFSGSFPSFVDTLRSLTGVAMDSNLFTGHISCGYKEEMRSNSTLAEFVTSTNFLSGTISDEFDSCMRMTALMLGHNLFSGSLPEAFSDMDRMTFFTVDDNRFSGTLPTLARMPHLTVVFVQSNTFSGGLDGLVDPSTQKELEYIDVGNNQLTGTLPSALFELSKLNGFTAVSNCITGPIPLSVCYPQYLYFLDLDGLTTAPACQRRFVPHSSLFTSYMLTGRVTEGIPSCLFNMSSLETLHLSGNAIQWSFPRDLVLSETLTDLSISHNILTGTIPKSIQRKEWTNLDLSYNRLTGVLHSNVKSAVVLSLVFPDKRRALNEWLTSKYRVLESWMAVFADSRGVASNLHQLGVSLNRVRFSLCRLTALILIVFMPTFIGLSFHYSTLFDQYAWFLSAAYLKGQTPAIIIATVSADALQHITASWTTRTVKYVSLFVVLLVNCSVMIALNSGYVYITLTYGTNMIVLAQVVVALFKLFWNDVIVRLLIQVARRFYASSEGEVSPQQSEFQTMRDSSSLYAESDPQSRLFRSLDGVIYTLLKPNRADSSQVLFFKEPFLLRIVGKLSIFLTFGVMFPPLAVVICVALCVDTYLVQLKIGYFLTSTRDEQLRHQYSLQLERDCQGVGEEQGYDSAGAFTQGCCTGPNCPYTQDDKSDQSFDMKCAWPHYLGRWMDSIFNATVETVNVAGHGATSQTVSDDFEDIMKRNQVQPFSDHDLIFLDLSVTDATLSSSEQRVGEMERALTSLVDKIFAHKADGSRSRPTVILLEMETLDRQGVHSAQYLRAYERVARAHRIPIWSYRDAVLNGFSQLQADSPETSQYVAYLRLNSLERANHHPPWHVHLFYADLLAVVLLREFDVCDRSALDRGITSSLNDDNHSDIANVSRSVDRCDKNAEPLLDISYDKKDNNAALTFTLNITSQHLWHDPLSRYLLRVRYLRSYTNAGVVDVLVCGHVISTLDALWSDFAVNKQSVAVPADFSNHIKYCHVLQYLGEFANAAEFLNDYVLRVSMDDPEYPNHLFCAGVIQKAMNKFEEANEKFFEASQVGPPRFFSKVEMMILISRTIEEKGMMDGEENEDDAYRMVFDNLKLEGQVDEEAEYEDWISKSETWLELGDKCAIHQLFSLATDFYARSILKDVDAFKKPMLWYKFAKSCYRCGRTSDAQLAVRQALTRAPYNKQLFNAEQHWSNTKQMTFLNLVAGDLASLAAQLPTHATAEDALFYKLQARIKGSLERNQLKLGCPPIGSGLDVEQPHKAPSTHITPYANKNYRYRMTAKLGVMLSNNYPV
eukprot:gene24925-31321_t